MDIIIEGKLVRQGDAELELPTEDWAVDFGKFVEARGLNVAELVERFTGKTGAQIHNTLRTELNRSQDERQKNYAPSGSTKRLCKRALETVMGVVTDDPELLRDLRRDFVASAKSQYLAGVFIEAAENALFAYGVAIPWAKTDDSAGAGSDSSSDSTTENRFEDDDEAEG